MSVETKYSAAESATIPKEEFMCPLCQCLLFEPVTTPCGKPAIISDLIGIFAIWLIFRFFFLSRPYLLPRMYIKVSNNV
jgi:hypothetical protein